MVQTMARQPDLPVASSPCAAVAPFTSRLGEEEARRQARLLKAVADPTRLRIVDLLREHAGDICVFELVQCFQLEQPTISHHLRILHDAGIVDCRKKGLFGYYYLCYDVLAQAQQALAVLVAPSCQA